MNGVRNVTGLWIRNFDIICQFLDLYPLYTNKKLDYQDWKWLIYLKKNKVHLTKEGLELMKKIKISMNKNRKNNI